MIKKPKKLRSLNKKILSAKQNTLALKREDLYGSMETNNDNKKQNIKKKNKKGVNLNLLKKI